MKILIFAGGTGRRLWPISRKKSPKQFEPIIGPKSTVQLAVERFLGTYSVQDILISTNEAYLGLLREQLPDIPEKNFIGEPVRRDLAAAVGLGLAHVRRHWGSEEPVAIIWGDNYMTRPMDFLGMMKSAEGILKEGVAKIVYIGETPRFANNNLGWIGLGSRLGDMEELPFYAYESWVYRPELDHCKQMFESGSYVWNTGYFVTQAGFILTAYERLMPAMWDRLSRIEQAIDQDQYTEVLNHEYPEMEVISFDDAIVQHIDAGDAVVLHGETGWSDPGTLYALKEAINPDEQANVEMGLVKTIQTNDSLLYNYEDGKLLTAVGLEGMIVVNTDDAILVVHKDDIRLVKALVDQLAAGELEDYS
jgi:mannose-1-phosphate guanylyltransferase